MEAFLLAVRRPTRFEYYYLFLIVGTFGGRCARTIKMQSKLSKWAHRAGGRWRRIAHSINDTIVYILAAPAEMSRQPMRCFFCFNFFVLLPAANDEWDDSRMYPLGVVPSIDLSHFCMHKVHRRHFAGRKFFNKCTPSDGRSTIFCCNFAVASDSVGVAEHIDHS